MREEIILVPMTDAMYHEYFRQYQSDQALCMDGQAYAAFHYDAKWVEAYIRKQRMGKRRCFAVMCGEEIVGEVLLKNIEEGCSAVMSICMKNDACKNRGYGTRAEQLAAAYAFEEMKLRTLYADVLVKNARSRHVLEKVGFTLTRTEGPFAFYRLER